MDKWGRIDVLIANAGILRDKSFAKMELKDFEAVVNVHLMGTVKPAKAVWEIMKAQGYGRIVVTTSSTGLYGNFGQTNYGAAKLSLVGFMNSLKLEGAKDNIRVNDRGPDAAFGAGNAQAGIRLARRGLSGVGRGAYGGDHHRRRGGFRRRPADGNGWRQSGP
jgi:NAD(P)-dependent dehydrogenase (short-subunit alcohol dehydrogenase family)